MLQYGQFSGCRKPRLWDGNGVKSSWAAIANTRFICVPLALVALAVRAKQNQMVAFQTNHRRCLYSGLLPLPVGAVQFLRSTLGHVIILCGHPQEEDNGVWLCALLERLLECLPKCVSYCFRTFLAFGILRVGCVIDYYVHVYAMVANANYHEFCPVATICASFGASTVAGSDSSQGVTVLNHSSTSPAACPLTSGMIL